MTKHRAHNLVLICIAILVSFTCAPNVFAQVPSTDEMGYKPYGSYDGSQVDTVNLDNLNLSLDIPLYSAPQRGRLGLSYSLPFTNTVWNLVTVCANGVKNGCTNTVTSSTGGRSGDRGSLQYHVPYSPG